MINVVWNRRISPKAAATTDEDGFVLMQFAFTDGRRIDVECRRENESSACGWQRVLFASPCYTTNVEVWLTRKGDYYIYAEPSNDIKEKLS